MKSSHRRCVQQTSTLGASIHTLCTHRSAYRLSPHARAHNYICQQAKLQKTPGRTNLTWPLSGSLCLKLLLSNTIRLCHSKVTKAWIPKCSFEVQSAHKLPLNDIVKRDNIIWWKKMKDNYKSSSTSSLTN